MRRHGLQEVGGEAQLRPLVLDGGQQRHRDLGQVVARGNTGTLSFLSFLQIPSLQLPDEVLDVAAMDELRHGRGGVAPEAAAAAQPHYLNTYSDSGARLWSAI